jgi:hypothetical protein
MSELNFHVKSWLSVWSLLIFISCNTAHKAVVTEKTKPVEQTPKMEIDTAGKPAKILFDSSAYHFGNVKLGEVLKKEIHFTNEGPGDLLIELISACECTKLDWSRLPIRKGSRSTIKLAYDSKKEKEGPHIVDIEVIANTIPPSTFTKFYLTIEK